MPKVADIMKDVTKDVKFNTHIEKVLSTTSSKIPSGAFIPTTIADLEKEIDIDLQEIRQAEAEITGQYFNEEEFKILKQMFRNEYFTEAEFKILKKVFREEDEYALEPIEDTGDMTVASTADTDAGETTVMSMDAVGEETPIEDDIDGFLNITADADADIGLSLEDDILSVDTGDVNLDINTAELGLDDTVPAEVADDNMVMAESMLNKIKKNIKTVMEQVAKYKENVSKPKIRKLKIKTNRKVENIDTLKQKLDSLLNEEKHLDVLALNDTAVSAESQELQGIQGLEEEDNVEVQVKESEKMYNAIKKNIKIVMEQINIYRKKFKNTKKLEVAQLQKKIMDVFTETQKYNEKTIFESLNKLTKKFDKLLETTFREEDDDVEDTEEETEDTTDFGLNDPVEDMPEALEKTDDVLTMKSDVSTEPAVLSIVLPDGVSPSDIQVKVMEESDGAPIITIELPVGTDTDSIEVTASEPEDMLNKSEKEVEDVVSEIPPVDDENKDTDDDDDDEINLPEEENYEEELEDEEEEDKFEEAVKVLNKKLLPVAENAKFVGHRANKNVMEAAQKPDTSYNTNVLKQTHLYYINEGKNISDYRYPIADVIDGTVYAIPQALHKMVEMFNNPSMVKKIAMSNKGIVKIARARLAAYLEAMGQPVPWKNKKKSNLVISEHATLLSICHKREAHNPSNILKKIREDMQK